MRILIHLIVLALAFSSMGCKRTCENVKVGDAQLSQNALGFLNYENGEVVVFTSDKGVELKFTVNRTEDKYFICQKITCDPLDPYKSSYCEYIEVPQISMYLNTDSILIGLTAGLEAYEPKTDLLYEFIGFTISHVNTSAKATYISEVRFNNPKFKREEITDIEHFVEELSSISLNGKTYENVLVCADEKLTLVYQRNKGFSGFIIDGITYTQR